MSKSPNVTSSVNQHSYWLIFNAIGSADWFCGSWWFCRCCSGRTRTVRTPWNETWGAPRTVTTSCSWTCQNVETGKRDYISYIHCLYSIYSMHVIFIFCIVRICGTWIVVSGVRVFVHPAVQVRIKYAKVPPVYMQHFIALLVYACIVSSISETDESAESAW